MKKTILNQILFLFVLLLAEQSTMYATKKSKKQISKRNAVELTLLQRPRKTYIQKKQLCLKCGNSYVNLERHNRIHTGEKPYQCNECKKRFNDRDNYKRHELSHINKKPYACAICHKGFKFPEYLKKHMIAFSLKENHPLTINKKQPLTLIPQQKPIIIRTPTIQEYPINPQLFMEFESFFDNNNILHSISSQPSIGYYDIDYDNSKK